MQVGTAVSEQAPQDALRPSQRRKRPSTHRPGKARRLVKQKGAPQGSDGWLACFIACEVIARRLRPYALDQGMCPSGARIFYYTTLALKRQGRLGSHGHSPRVLSWEMTDAFLDTALTVSANLLGSYAAGVRLRKAPLKEGARLLGMNGGHRSGFYLRQEPREDLQPPGTASASLARLLVPSIPQIALLTGQFLTERVPLSPVARPQDSLPVALRLLKAQLAQEIGRTKQVPDSEVYLYEEPLHIWLWRLIQTHSWD